ncbi:MAG: efflux RND transporter permease subunit [Candidatus Cloacimonadales bacterium]
MFNITKFSINKPVTISMIFVIIALTSIVVLWQLPISYFPNVEFPRLNVNTYWQGAAPEEVEKYITSLIEETGSTIQGVTRVNSISKTSISSVQFYLQRGIDLDYARFELNEQLQLLGDKLPPRVQPQIQAYIPQQLEQTSFLEYGISGPYETWELKELVEQSFLFRLAALSGIADVAVSGAQARLVQIELKDSNLDQVDYQTIQRTLLAYGQRSSINNLADKQRTISLRLDDSFAGIAEIGKLQISRNNGSRVRLEDIAEISYGLEPASLYRRYQGEPQVVLTINKENSANAIKLAARAKQIMQQQMMLLPSNLTLVTLTDEAEEISKDLKVLYQRGFFSLLIIFLVLIIFLRHFKSTLLIVSSIFLSLALTFLFMYLLRIGLNLLSLAGLALGFGLIVDNSIVIYENIFRNRSRGLARREAAIVGAQEVALPIVASTFTTMIVFAPFLFLQGDFKILYLPFIKALTLALFSSLLISFTFIPFASTHILNQFSDKRISEEHFHFDPNLNIFQKFLNFLLRFRWIWLILITLFLAFTIRLFIQNVDKGYVWNFPKDDYLMIRISLPTGSNIEQTDFIVRKFEDILQQETTKSWKTYVSGSYGQIRVDFTEAIKATAYPLVLREKLKAYAINYGNTDVYVMGFGPSFGGSGGSYANFNLKFRGYNHQKLQQQAQLLADFMPTYSRRVRDININAISQWNSEILYEYQLEFDRQKMASYQIDISSVIYQLSLFLQSREGSLAQKVGNKEYLFSIQEADNTFDLEQLRNFSCSNRLGQPIEISAFTQIEKVEVLSEIKRIDRLYERNINFDFRGSYKKGEKFIEELIAVYPRPLGYLLEAGESFSSGDEEENRKLLWVMLAAIVLVYMSLAALFESLRSPFVIILSLPLAFIGVTYMFYFFDETFNAYARMGLILLTGIVVNNSIILVYRIIQLQEHGIALNNAILQATRDRTRPIVMTSLTTIMGLLPLLLRTDVDKGDFWRMLAFSTIGGLSAATIFTLIATPILYRIFSNGKTGGWDEQF